MLGPRSLIPPYVIGLAEVSDADLGHLPTTGANTISIGTIPLSWRFCLAMRPEVDPTHPEFVRVDSRSTVIRDEATMDTVLNASWAAYQEILRDAQISGPIRTGEADIWKKITIQRGTRADRILTRLYANDVEPPPDWVDLCHSIARIYAQAFSPTAVPSAPLDTNAGWPSYQTSIAGKAISALLWPMNKDPRAVHDLGVRFADWAYLPLSSVNSFGLNFRQGPRYKLEPWYVHAGAGTWVADSEYGGIAPRQRGVYMSPYGSNQRMERLLERMQGARQNLVGLWRGGLKDRLLVKSAYERRFRIGEADISAYDLSVSRPVQEAVGRALLEAFPDLAHEVATWLYMESRPVVGPRWDLARGATLTLSRGCTHSGIRLTAEIGTFICLTTALWAWRRLGLRDPIKQWLSGEILLLVQGDDLLIGAPELPDSDAWNETWQELGFECAITNGCRFLMKHRTAKGDFPVGGRIVQQTVSNEHEPLDPDASIMTLLGLAARWGAGPPVETVKYVDSVLRLTDLYARWGLRSGSDAAKKVREPYIAAMLQEALKRRAKEGWLRILIRDAPYRPSAAAELRIIQQLGFQIPEEDTTLSSVLNYAINHVTEARRMDVIKRLWDEIVRGSALDNDTLLGIINGTVPTFAR